MDEPETVAPNVIREQLGYLPLPCEHHWVSQHKPDHVLYWVKICSICHEPDWDDLDQEIRKLLVQGDQMGELIFTWVPGNDPEAHYQCSTCGGLVAGALESLEDHARGHGQIMFTVNALRPIRGT